MIFLQKYSFDWINFNTMSSTVGKRARYPETVRRAAISASIKANPDNWKHHPYWYWGSPLSLGCKLDDHDELYLVGTSNEASESADTKTINPPPNERPETM